MPVKLSAALPTIASACMRVHVHACQHLGAHAHSYMRPSAHTVARFYRKPEHFKHIDGEVHRCQQPHPEKRDAEERSRQIHAAAGKAQAGQRLEPGELLQAPQPPVVF